MPNNMTPADKMALTMAVYNNVFTSKANGIDIVTVRIVHANIVNGLPIISNNVRVGGEVNGRWFKNSATGLSTLRGFDIDIQTDNKILQLRFLEQNPDKTDVAGNLKVMANAARRGSKILWLINRKVQINGFLGRVQDGVFHASQDRAVVPVAAAQVVQPPTNNQAQVASRLPEGGMKYDIADRYEEEMVEQYEDQWDENSIPELEDAGIPDYVMQYYENMEPGNESEFAE